MAAGGKKAAAAAAELGDGPVEFSWRGATFTRPARVPATLAFDLAEIEEGAGITAIIRLIGAFVGTEQLTKVRAQVDADGVALGELEDALAEFINAALEPSAVEMGESPASAGS
jgi:hypothetical protein